MIYTGSRYESGKSCFNILISYLCHLYEVQFQNACV